MCLEKLLKFPSISADMNIERAAVTMKALSPENEKTDPSGIFRARGKRSTQIRQDKKT